MAKAKGGHRGGKAQTSNPNPTTANSTNGPTKKADKENSSDLQNTNSKGRNRHREKQKIIVSYDSIFREKNVI